MQPIREKINELPPAAFNTAWWVAVVLAGGVTWAGFSAWRAGEGLRERAEAVVALLDAEPAEAKDAAAPGKRVAAVTRTGERRFFSPAAPQGFRSAQGVLGDRVLYPGGQSFAVGDNAMGATVKKIDLDHVELEFEGEIIRVKFGSGGGSASSPRRGGRSFRSRGRRSR